MALSVGSPRPAVSGHPVRWSSDFPLPLLMVEAATDQGLSDRVIAEGLAINPYTVARVRKRFCEEGLVSALTERPRPGQKRKLSGKQEAHLIAIACSEPPEGHTHWTLKLLAERVVNGQLGRLKSVALRRNCSA